MTATVLQTHNAVSSSLLPFSISLKTPRTVISAPFQKQDTKTSLKELCKQGSIKDAFFSLLNSSNHSSQEAYSSILELCALQKAAVQGKQVHACMLKTGSIFLNGFLCTKLLFMYAKCGRLTAAHQLFDELSQRTIFDWNALISAFASSDKPETALQLYWNMRMLGVMPDGCTFVSVLKACGLVEDLRSGIEIHSLAVKCGLTFVSFAANALVSMYAKCGQFNLAWKLFEWMPEKDDVVLWNSIISGCVQSARYSDAISVFREMHRIGLRMNSYTAVSILQACTELSQLKLCREIHGSLLKTHRNFELYEGNALLVMYTRNGYMSNAVQLFHEMHEKDNVSLNSLLSGYVQNSSYVDAVEYFIQLIEMGYQPDQVSLITVASALGRLGNLLNGKEIHGYAIKQGFDSNLLMGNAILDMYTKCCHVSYSKLIFHKIFNKDVISWTTMIACYAQNSYCYEAIELFRQMQKEGLKADPMLLSSILLACNRMIYLSILKQIHGYAIRHMFLDLVLENTIIDAYGDCGVVSYALNIFNRIMNKDLVSWTSMITCYIHNWLYNDALSLFVKMMKVNVEPDMVALLGILSATAGLASLLKGKEVHGFLMRRCLKINGYVNCSLVDMYAMCGRIDESFKVFNGVKYKDLALWTCIIDACGMHGRGRDAIALFDQMETLGVLPDHITFLVLLYACSHCRLVTEGKSFFDKMINKYNLEPWPEHYACIVDLLGRAGRLDESYKFIRKLPTKPTAPMWSALLSACQVHSNHELGELAAVKLLELEPNNPGNYVLISNSLAAMGKWEDAKELRLTMKKRGLKKDPACSWIEVGKKVHAFVARDKCHEDSSKIYAKLAEITRSLEKEAGYTADTRFVLHDVGEEEKITMLHAHSERIAIAFGFINIPQGSIIRITKNLRVCGDCHVYIKLVSKVFRRDIIVRDTNFFHHFKNGSCSCGDFW